MSATSISVWQHVNLSEQIRPWDTLACCWDVKQANKQPTYLSVVGHTPDKAGLSPRYSCGFPGRPASKKQANEYSFDHIRLQVRLFSRYMKCIMHWHCSSMEYIYFYTMGWTASVTLWIYCRFGISFCSWDAIYNKELFVLFWVSITTMSMCLYVWLHTLLLRLFSFGDIGSSLAYDSFRCMVKVSWKYMSLLRALCLRVMMPSLSLSLSLSLSVSLSLSLCLSLWDEWHNCINSIVWCHIFWLLWVYNICIYLRFLKSSVFHQALHAFTTAVQLLIGLSQCMYLCFSKNTN